MRVLITGAGGFIGGHIAARDRQGGIVAAAVPDLAAPSLSYDAGARSAASGGSSFLEGSRVGCDGGKSICSRSHLIRSTIPEPLRT
jgi:hypothetical protein